MTSSRPSSSTNRCPVLLPSWSTNVPVGHLPLGCPGAIVEYRAHRASTSASRRRLEHWHACQGRTVSRSSMLKLSAADCEGSQAGAALVTGRKSPMTSRNSRGDCNCGTWAQPGMILRQALRQAGRQFVRHRRRRRLVVFADQHQDRHLHLAKLGPQIERSPAHRRRRETPPDRCAGKPRGDPASGPDARPGIPARTAGASRHP